MTPAYFKARYDARKEATFDLLGRACALCGSTEQLEFDHIDPSTKCFHLSHGFYSEERYWAEAKKCRTLCGPCHRALPKGPYNVSLNPATDLYRYRRREAARKRRARQRGPDWIDGRLRRAKGAL
jgi:hypothetical protein